MHWLIYSLTRSSRGEVVCVTHALQIARSSCFHEENQTRNPTEKKIVLLVWYLKLNSISNIANESVGVSIVSVDELSLCGWADWKWKRNQIGNETVLWRV